MAYHHLTTVEMTSPSVEEDLLLEDMDQRFRLIARLHQYIVPPIFAVIIIAGIIGNLLVIYVILSKKKLQTVTNLLLMSLAISDVSFLLVCGGFSVVHYVLSEWPLGDVLCRVIQYLLYVTCYVTVYTLIMVSAVRFLLVVYRDTAKKYCSKRNATVLIALTWIIFMLAKIPILIVHREQENRRTGRRECIIVGKTDGRRLFASFFVFAYALPLLIICTLYLLILRHIRSKRSMTLNGHVSTSSNGNAAATTRNRHVTKCVVIVVLTFAVCWLPLHVHLLVAYYHEVPDSDVSYNVLLIIWQALSFLNSTLNPIIYNYFSKEFRRSFRSIMCCTEEPAYENSTNPTQL